MTGTDPLGRSSDAFSSTCDRLDRRSWVVLSWTIDGLYARPGKRMFKAEGRKMARPERFERPTLKFVV